MSSTIDFQDAMRTLQSMFSHVHRDQIKQILLSHRGVMERAVDTLLRIPDTRPVRGSHAPAAVSVSVDPANIEASILELEQLKATAIQCERFLEAEDLKNRIQALRAQQLRHQQSTSAAAAAASSSSSQSPARTGGGHNPFNTDFDELTPLFLRKRQRRNVDLPEYFLRSPAFRQAAIKNKILASGLALQMHDEMQQQQQEQQEAAGGARGGGTGRGAGGPGGDAGGQPRAPSKASLWFKNLGEKAKVCLLYTSPSPRDRG